MSQTDETRPLLGGPEDLGKYQAFLPVAKQIVDTAVARHMAEGGDIAELLREQEAKAQQQAFDAVPAAVELAVRQEVSRIGRPELIPAAPALPATSKQLLKALAKNAVLTPKRKIAAAALTSLALFGGATEVQDYFSLPTNVAEIKDQAQPQSFVEEDIDKDRSNETHHKERKAIEVIENRLKNGEDIEYASGYLLVQRGSNEDMTLTIIESPAVYHKGSVVFMFGYNTEKQALEAYQMGGGYREGAVYVEQMSDTNRYQKPQYAYSQMHIKKDAAGKKYLVQKTNDAYGSGQIFAKVKDKEGVGVDEYIQTLNRTLSPGEHYYSVELG